MAYFSQKIKERLGDVLAIFAFLVVVRAVMIIAQIPYGNFPIIDPLLYWIWDWIQILVHWIIGETALPGYL